MFPIGNKIKVTSMHLTIATLLLKEEEVEKVQNQLPDTVGPYLTDSRFHTHL